MGYFQVQAPGCLYLEGRFNGGFFCVTSLGGLYLEGLIHGGAYFRNFTVSKGDFLKRKATSSNDPLIGKQFKDEPNKTNNAIKKAKRKNFSEIPDANKGDPHKTWRFINKLQSSQK